MQLAKGSAGFQIGASSTDLVLVVMNDRGVERLLHNKVTLGGDASIAAGPVGRAASAATDAQMTSEMLAYSRSKGIFAGVDLSGGTLKPDEDANERAYGPGINPSDVALGRQNVVIPPEAQAFVRALNRENAPTTGVSKPARPAKPSGTSQPKKPTGTYR
jgi:lipid-binding SYLF domain-containing protein